MSKLLVNISYACMQAYEFDGIRALDEVQKYQYHQVLDFQRNDEVSTLAGVKDLFDELVRKLSDAFGNGWKNNLCLVALWSPEFSESQKSEFKQLLLTDGVRNFDFYEPSALSNYLLQRSEKFNATCNYAINIWANRRDVYLQLYHFTKDGEYKLIDKIIAEKAAEDPRVPFLTKMMLRELSHYVEDVNNEEPIVRTVAENFINSGEKVSNEIVTLSSGYQKTFLLTDEFKDSSTNGSDILNKSLASLLAAHQLDEKECQVVLSETFAEKRNLLDVATRMFTYVCDEDRGQTDAVFKAAFRQLEYTLRTSQSLQQRIAFCGDGYMIDRPVLITWTCPKCGYSCECEEAPQKCPNCHVDDIPDIVGDLSIDAEIHETKTGMFFNRKIVRQLEITVNPINGGIAAKLLLIVGKKPIGVYNSNVGIGRWIHEFPDGIHEKVSIVVTQDEFPALAQSGTTYIDIKPHYTYQDVNAFVVTTKKL